MITQEKVGFSILGYFPGGRQGVEDRIYGVFKDKLSNPKIYTALVCLSTKFLREPTPEDYHELREGNRIPLTEKIIEDSLLLSGESQSDVFGEYTIPDGDMTRLEEWMDQIHFVSMGGVGEPAADDSRFRIFMLTRAIDELVRE